MLEQAVTTQIYPVFVPVNAVDMDYVKEMDIAVGIVIVTLDI